jgi:hypothetical protein
VDLMHLAQDRDQLWDPVKTVINLRGSIRGGEFLHYMNDFAPWT